MGEAPQIEIDCVEKDPGRPGDIRVDDDRVRRVTGARDEGECLRVGAQGKRANEGQTGYDSFELHVPVHGEFLTIGYDDGLALHDPG